jgi:hypothetical protein
VAAKKKRSEDTSRKVLVALSYWPKWNAGSGRKHRLLSKLTG